MRIFLEKHCYFPGRYGNITNNNEMLKGMLFYEF